MTSTVTLFPFTINHMLASQLEQFHFPTAQPMLIVTQSEDLHLDFEQLNFAQSTVEPMDESEPMLLVTHSEDISFHFEQLQLSPVEPMDVVSPIEELVEDINQLQF